MKIKGTLGRSAHVEALERAKAGRRGPFEDLRTTAQAGKGSICEISILSEEAEDDEDIIEVPDPGRRPSRKLPLSFPYPNEFNREAIPSWLVKRGIAPRQSAARPFGRGRPLVKPIVMPAWFASSMTFMKFK